MSAYDDKIELAKVPTNIREAANKALPRVRWTGATKSVEDGKVTYQLEGEDTAKGYVWVELTADAKVNEVGSEIVIEQGPADCHRGAQKEIPPVPGGVNLRGSQRRQSDQVRLRGETPRDKKEITVSVSVDGKEIEIDDR